MRNQFSRLGAQSKTDGFIQLARDIAATLAAKFGLVGLGLVSNVIVTRVLGPEGRGVYIVALTVGAVGVQLGSLGLQAANTYAVARDRGRLPVLLGNSVAFCFASAVMALVVWVAFLRWPSIAPLPEPALLLALAWVPIGLAYVWFQGLLLGLGRVRAFNAIELVAPCAALVLFVGLTVSGVASPQTFVAITLVSQALAVALIVLALQQRGPVGLATSLSTFRELFHYGARAYAAGLFGFLVLRSDLLLVTTLLGAESAGQYSVAVLIADTICLLPVAAGTIMFPRLSRMLAPGDRLRIAVRISIVVGLFTLLATLLVGVFAGSMISVLFGGGFLPAVPAILWLLPGLVPLAINTIYMNYFAATGMPVITILSPALAFALNLAANVILIPRFGIAGASMASSLAYFVMLVCSISYIAQRKVRR